MHLSLAFSIGYNKSFHRMCILYAKTWHGCHVSCCFQREVFILLAHQLLSSTALERIWHCILCLSKTPAVKINISCFSLYVRHESKMESEDSFKWWVAWLEHPWPSTHSTAGAIEQTTEPTSQCTLNFIYCIEFILIT